MGACLSTGRPGPLPHPPGPELSGPGHRLLVLGPGRPLVESGPACGTKGRRTPLPALFWGTLI